METPSLSVILPIYAGDSPDELAESLQSILDQSHPADEIIVVIDGGTTSNSLSTVKEFKNDAPELIRMLQLDQECRLGPALAKGVEEATHDLIARQDADDVSVYDRFEKQLKFFSENPEVDIVGGHVREFDANMESMVAKREVPIEHDKIRQTAKFRCPMNHMSVMFRRQSVTDVGNYQDIYLMEDYDLWVRMLLNGAKFRNLPSTLSKVRSGDEMYQRRGGWKYAKQEIRFQQSLYKRDFISISILIFNLFARSILRLIPNKLRRIIYQKVARN